MALSTDSPYTAYRNATRPIRIKLLLKRLKCPFMYHPLLRRIVMKSGLQTIEVTSTPKR